MSVLQKLALRGACLLLCLGSGVAVYAAAPTSCAGSITISSLPYTMATSDTCYILSGNLTTTGSAITVNASNILLEMGDDTVFFGTGGGDSARGLIFSSDAYHDIAIKNGTFYHNSSDTSAWGGAAVYVDGGYNILLYDVNLRVMGYAGHCVHKCSGDTVHTVEFNHGTWDNDCTSYLNRFANQCLTAKIQDATMATHGWNGYDSTTGYHWILCSLTVNGPGGIGVRGKPHIFDCDITVDARNDTTQYEIQSVYSFANSAGIGTQWILPGMKIHDNTITAGTTYYGCDEGLIIQGNNGDPNLWGEIYDNTVSVHFGKDICEYNWSLWTKAIKMRYGNKYLKVYNNDFTTTIGDTSQTSYGIRGAAIFYNAGRVCTESYPPCGQGDSNVYIYGNTFTVDTVGTDIYEDGLWGCQISSAEVDGGGHVSGYDWDGANIQWYGNTFNVSGWVYAIGNNDGSCSNIRIKRDTVNHGSQISGITHWLAYVAWDWTAGDSSFDNRLVDMYYTGGNETDCDVYASTSYGTLELDRTLTLYVSDGGSPANAIPVATINAYGDMTWDTTNAQGLANPIVRYRWWCDDVADSTGFNDFRSFAVVGGDTLWDTLTVAWNSYTDTLGVPLSGGVMVKKLGAGKLRKVKL